MTRINNLTGVKAFAALWVLIFHATHTRSLEQFGWGDFVNRGYLGVDIFFVLSGFILAHVYAERFLRQECFNLNLYKEFIVKRFARLYPLHLFTFCFFAVLWMLGTALNYRFGSPDSFSQPEIIYNLLMIHAWGISDHLSWNTVSWSISAEWFAYLTVFPFAIYLLNRGNLKSLGLVVLIFWVLGFGYAYNYRGNIALTTNAVPRITFEFLAGILCNRMALLSFVNRYGSLLFWLGVLGLIVISQVNSYFEFFTLPIICCFILGLNSDRIWINKIFGNTVAVFLGEISYSLYMTHPIVNIIFNQIMQKLHLHPTQLEACTLMIPLIFFPLQLQL